MRSKKLSPAPVLAWLFLLVLVLAALWPSLFTPFDPLANDLKNALQPPSWEHPLGTDQTGRDVLSRIVYGARFSLLVGFGAALGAAVIGTLLGVLLGSSPRWVDAFLMRAVEILMAFPDFLIALVVLAILGGGPLNVALAVLLGSIPAYIRLARSATLSARQTDYAQAAALLGVHPALVLRRHVVPATLRPIVVLATVGIGTAIVTASGLSFLGLGAQEPTPDWGLMLASSRDFLGKAWWLAVFPGLVIILTVLSVSVVSRSYEAAQERVGQGGFLVRVMRVAGGRAPWRRENTFL
ncbi:ABC transporter permease [Lysinibacter sp. HNR]|uniref:ABC transporter permease n=1 Tax=Lysinibacter sp. HNR TaxID=3031408 RepID=UPI0024357A99|nr:ABC transporter permease [Lysinibacter sp. HNR]WGD36366.1 ABC transporter permease [Lysinibacter sp. HNR]